MGPDTRPMATSAADAKTEKMVETVAEFTENLHGVHEHPADGDRLYKDYMDEVASRQPRVHSRAQAASGSSAAPRTQVIQQHRPTYAPADRDGYPYLEGDIREHPTIRTYLPCHPLVGDDRALKDASLIGAASDAWYPERQDRHLTSEAYTPQDAHIYGRTDEGGSKELSNRWMLAAAKTDWVPQPFNKTKMEPLALGLTPKCLRDPYKAGVRKGPPTYAAGEIKHYGLDHRKRFPYTVDQSCDELPIQLDPSIATAFNPLPFDQLESSPWRAPVRSAPTISGSNLAARGINYPHYGYSDQSCTGSDTSHRAFLKPNFYSYGHYDTRGSYSQSDVCDPYHPSSMGAPYVQHHGHRHGSYAPR